MKEKTKELIKPFLNQISSEIQILANQTKSLVDLKTYLEIGYTVNENIEYEQIPVFADDFEKRFMKFFFLKIYKTNEKIISANLKLVNHFQKRSKIEIQIPINLEVVQNLINQNISYIYEFSFEEKENEIRKRLEDKKNLIQAIQKMIQELPFHEKELEWLIEELEDFLRKKEEFFKKPQV